MCGVLGFYVAKYGHEEQQFLSNLLKETTIRGLHAIGCSIYDYSLGRVNTTITSLDEYQKEWFGKEGALLNVTGRSLLAIFHTRYSTSDLRYNQPIADQKFSIVHNGVISQAEPEKWSEAFGLSDFKTRNDSEILFKIMKEHRLKELESTHETSIAMVGLDGSQMFWYRNAERPLHEACTDTMLVIASTADIINRAKKETRFVIRPNRAKPGVLYRFESGKEYRSEEPIANFKEMIPYE